MEKTWRTLDVLAKEQQKIDEELNAYHQELITRAKATGNSAGDCAAAVAEEMKRCKFPSDTYKNLMAIYNDMMKRAE